MGQFGLGYYADHGSDPTRLELDILVPPQFMPDGSVWDAVNFRDVPESLGQAPVPWS